MSIVSPQQMKTWRKNSRNVTFSTNRPIRPSHHLQASPTPMHIPSPRRPGPLQSSPASAAPARPPKLEVENLVGTATLGQNAEPCSLATCPIRPPPRLVSLFLLLSIYLGSYSLYILHLLYYM